MKEFNSVREELLFIYEKNGGVLNPHKIVKFAENPKTHLHKEFEWDDGVAAFKYRIWQARRIINLEFEVIKTDKGQKETRLFVSLIPDRSPEKGYRLITDVMNEPDLRQQLIGQALKELIHFKTKYQVLNELSEVFSAIEKLEAKQISIEI